jgi:hypothetical protein
VCVKEIFYIIVTDLFGLTSQKISVVVSEVLHFLAFFPRFFEVTELVSKTISNRNSLYFFQCSVVQVPFCYECPSHIWA